MSHCGDLNMFSYCFFFNIYFLSLWIKYLPFILLDESHSVGDERGKKLYTNNEHGINGQKCEVEIKKIYK